MVTVRFPTGFSVQYNNLNQIDWDRDGSHGAMLYGSKTDGTRDSGWSVHVPADCIIEFVTPCRTYNAAREETESQLKLQIDALRKEVRSLARKIGKQGGK